MRLEPAPGSDANLKQLNFALGWPLVRLPRVGGVGIPLPARQNDSGFQGGGVRLASAFHGGGVAGCGEGVPFAVLSGLGAFLHEPFCCCFNLHPQSTAVMQNVKSALEMSNRITPVDRQRSFAQS